MTSSTPSPSAQELADQIRLVIQVQCEPTEYLSRLCDQIMSALRRLAETERERDEARTENARLQKIDEIRKHAVDRWVGCPDCQDKHDTARDGCLRCKWQRSERLREKAESERDALREMLAQADAVIALLDDVQQVELEVADAAPEHIQEARARHRQRLAEKDKE